MTRIVSPLLIISLIGLCIVYAVKTSRASTTSNTTTGTPTPRVYYIAATETLWNYFPAENSSDSGQLNNSYIKAVFREFTDDTFQTPTKERPEWLGILGPLIEAEVGDVIEVHFFNNASTPLSIHPHGLSYNKSNEGAYYQDNTTEDERNDDKVPPNGTYIYTWTLPESNAPTSSDPDCLTMAYHSHFRADTDIHTGLIGPLLLCKKGVLSTRQNRNDKSHVIFLMFLIFDENQSWYLERNIEEKFPHLNTTEIEKLKEKEEFQESNLIHTINGLKSGTLEGLHFCIGDEVEWRLIGMGNEVDLHTVTFQHHLIMYNGHRSDVVSLVPAKFTTSHMTVRHEGIWKVTSETGSQSSDGMVAYFTAKQCETSQINQNTFRINSNPRTHYIAIERTEWNYAPSGINKFNNKNLLDDENAAVFFEHSSERIGGRYKKVVYREYLDETFTNKTDHGSDLGILGPILRVEVGKTIKLVIKNKANRTYSIYSPGVEIYDVNGTLVNDTAIEPGSTFDFYWYVPQYYTPSEKDSSCITWRYYSTVDFIKDAYSGLNGVLLTCKEGALDQIGKQKNVEKEFALLFAVLDENESHYIGENIAEYCGSTENVDTSDEDFQESNLMHAINGRMYGNLEGLNMDYNDTVSWHIIAIGKETDIHTAYFHGQTFLQYGVYKDTIALFPSTHYTVQMVADNPGEWDLDCKTVDHYLAGMKAKYLVTNTNSNVQDYNNTEGQNKRTYYLAAVEQDWDYATHARHLITGEKLTENEDSKIFVTRDDHHIGRVYKKVVYMQYLDENFTQLVQKPSHLGILGPMIKAEVGDIIRILFKNMAEARSYSIHLHGVIEISDMQPTPPNRTSEYVWKVPERSGPGKSDFNCHSYSYYSDVDVVKDTNAGLVGPLVICKKGTLTETGERKDVAREFALLFTVFDENLSWYLNDNKNTYCYKPDEVNEDDEDFKESNLKHGINGRLYGSLEGLEANFGDRIAWYFIGLGNEVDIHTAHFHGVTFVNCENGKHRGDVVELIPGVFETVEMVADNAGKWLLHCHVDDHVKAGMKTLFIVKKS